MRDSVMSTDWTTFADSASPFGQLTSLGFVESLYLALSFSFVLVLLIGISRISNGVIAERAVRWSRWRAPVFFSFLILQIALFLFHEFDFLQSIFQSILSAFLFTSLYFAFFRKQRETGEAHGSMGHRCEWVQKYESVLGDRGFSFFEWTPSSKAKSRMVWSSQMYKILGFQGRPEASVNLLVSLVHPEDRHRFYQFLECLNMDQAGDRSDFQIRVRVLSEYKWFQFHLISEELVSSSSSCFLVEVQDISETRTLAEKLERMKEDLEIEVSKRTLQLEIANRAKTRFLANMSHEMRTPLGLVLGFAETLKEKVKADPESFEYVRLILKNGEILSRVMNDLLDLTKIESGRMQFRYGRVRIRSLISDLREAFSDLAAEKDLHLSFQNPGLEDEVVVTDEVRLKQILYTLLSNAIKFTDQGNVVVTFGKKDEHYFADIVDTGSGMTEEEKMALTDSTRLAELIDAGKSQMPGLGLSLAHKLAKALGGQLVLVSSQIGKGSHFRLTFENDEAKLQHQQERKQANNFNSQLQDYEIFALDDNPDNIRLAEIFLRRLGCRVRGFTSPKSLFAEIVSRTPDLILLDIHMPEMNGFEVYTYLRKTGYKNPIWALTAYSLNEDIQKILEYGFDDFIRKPMSIENMKRKLAFELRERSND